MEGWQKGADAVIKMSGAGKENYFKNFPERKEWFQTNYPEHFGRSAAAATTSLKKVTKAKQQKQRLAAIRQAAEKRNQSTVLTPERRLMAQRRRESGEGLAGGMDTVADIRKTIAAGMPVRSGGIGSLFEQEEQQQGVYQKDGKWFYNGAEYKDQETALNAQRTDLKNQELRDELSKVATKFDSLSSMKDNRQPQKTTKTSNLAATSSGRFVWDSGPGENAARAGAALAGLPNAQNAATPDGSPVELDDTKVDGREWQKSNPDWGVNLGMTYPTNVIDTATELKLLQTPQTSAGRKSDRAYRKPFSNYISIRADEGYVKELAEKTIQECMPMPGSMMPLKMRILSMKSKDEGSEQTEAEDEPGEYDYEGDMAKSQLRSIMHNSKMLHDMLEDNTNLPEWVQSKITLAEDYILTAANYMRGELDKMNEEVEEINEIKKATLMRYVQKAVGEIGQLGYDVGRSHGLRDAGILDDEIDADEEDKNQDKLTRRTRGVERASAKLANEEVEQIEESNIDWVKKFKLHLKDSRNPNNTLKQRKYAEAMASRAIEASKIADPDKAYRHYMGLSVRDNVGEEVESVAEGEKKSKSDDLVKRSMLPDRSVIPAGKGFGDDLKRQKIMKKVGKALQKKKMALPTDNPSANELVPQSMLPDVPGYPQGYQMEEQIAEQIAEQVVEQPVEQQVEAPVVEENVNPFVAAGSKFLTRTSTRLVYGEKDE